MQYIEISFFLILLLVYSIAVNTETDEKPGGNLPDNLPDEASPADTAQPL